MAEKVDAKKSPEPEDNSYIRTAVTLGNEGLITDWLQVSAHQQNKAEVTDMVLVPAAMYGQLSLLEQALEYGDLSKQDSDPKYPGWLVSCHILLQTLMHFAVEGAQRVVVMSHRGDEELHNELREPYLTANQPRSVEEVRWKQLDIIMQLYKGGAPISLEDDNGDSASDRACRRLEDPFLEGAMLLDILSLLDSQSSPCDAKHIDTPGLSCIPSGRGWQRAIQQLVEWAYHRQHYKILQFCHRKRYAELDSPSLMLTSPEFSLRRQRRPILVDSVITRDFNILRIILTTPPIKHDVLSKMYEFVEGNISYKRSILSYACELYQNRVTEEDSLVMSSLLSKDIIGVHLTNITICGVGLRALPIVLFHHHLKTLDVRENILDHLPMASTLRDGLGWDCPQLEILNIAHNHFTEIPRDIFRLKSLARFIAMNNHIRTLPQEVWSAPSLKILDLSENQIQVLPCHLPHSRVSHTFSPANTCMVQHHMGRVFLNQALPLNSIKHGYINYDIDSSNPHAEQVGFALQTLDLTGNQITEIPRSLPCLAPLLQTLKLANNRLNALGQASDYPPLLQMLDVRNNGIVSPLQPSLVTPPICCVQSEVANVSQVCSHLQHENLANLKFLYMSFNRLTELVMDYQPRAPDTGLEDSMRSEVTQVPRKLLFPKLQGLHVSSNRLTKLPEDIHRLEKLCELAFDNNPGIIRLPRGLHRLTNLFTLRYQGISDPVVAELSQIRNTAEVLYYLKARESEAVVNQSMRLFVIGHHSKGKTTLLQALKGNVRRTNSVNSFDQRSRRIGPGLTSLTPEERISTVGIELGKWECSLKRRHKSEPHVTFYTWDFAGQEEYYVTHQCFLTNRALYLLVWNVENGQAGINSLSIWLQNMQARAQGYSHNVIIVGTHLDKIPRQEREAKKRAWTEQLERYSTGRSQSRSFPKIMGVAFVGCIPGKNVTKFIDLDLLNDIIYNVATNMKAPKDFSSAAVGLTMNIVDEKIPQSYEQLRLKIESIATEMRQQRRPPVLKRDEFYERVKDIIATEEEINTAVRFLHTTTGVVLHFDQPLVVEYFIVDPQKWFDLCALVIAPDNVSSLVSFRGRMGDDKYGLLSCRDMNNQFEQQGCDSNVSKIIRTFLAQFHIIHQISADYYLVPSAISSTPQLPQDSEVGSFPRKAEFQLSTQPPSVTGPSLPSVLPLACKSPDEVQLAVKTTGLIYRRFILLPPIASGFWSKLIALFLQKKDFNKLVEDATPPELGLKAMGPAHRLRAHIGNIEFVWSFWKTGIVLYLGECVALRVNSFQAHEFEDPLAQQSLHNSMFASRHKQVRNFFYQSRNRYKTFPAHYREVIEVVTPELVIENCCSLGKPHNKPLTARILAKALEIVDEVVKSHCEHLCTSGIYSHTDMAHVVPCPLCFGDADCRGRQQLPHLDDDNISISDSYSNVMTALNPETLNGLSEEPTIEQLEGVESDDEEVEDEVVDTGMPEGSIFVMTVESLIKETFTSDVVKCPTHRKLEIEHLAPDLVFADLVDVKLDKGRFSAQINKDDIPVASGSFGKVFRNTLSMENEEELEVAVKVFDQPDSGMYDVSTEIIRSYADMRYELNKLSLLSHPHIVRFIGVLTNPHSFVLEWAPMKSLEHIRASHGNSRTPLCASSIFQVLVQVTSALTYLHSKVGIVHQDLRCSNILVFKFPAPEHLCYREARFAECEVCVKVTDMGISANPLVHRAGENNGLKLMVPECLSSNTMATLTEKVDMFCLGSCLYELMTLRGLPPADISQPEYSIMLQSGKRAQFHTKDPHYPLYLFQTLEDCWQQEHYNRPPANTLCGVLMQLMNITLTRNTYCPQEMSNLLLDSFTLHLDKRLAQSEVSCREGKLNICVAMATRDDISTTIATMRYQDDVRSELAVESSGAIKNHTVIALHQATDGHIFVALEDGSLILYNQDHVKHTTTPAESCCNQQPHGDIVRMYFDPAGSILVIGFAGGMVHIKKCTQGVEKSIISNVQWRVFCGELTNSKHLCSLECITSSGNAKHSLEIWCGTRSDSIEVWQLDIDPSTTWASDTVPKCRTVSQIMLDMLTKPKGSHRDLGLKVSEDGLRMVVLVKSSSKSRATNLITIVDVTSKTVVKSFSWEHFPVACVVLTSRKLAVGTFNGEVYVFDARKLLESPDSSLKQSQCALLRAHKPKSRIYSLACIEGHITASGTTSMFPAFVGRCDVDTPRDFLVSVGYGREYTDLGEHGSRIFRSSLNREGTFVNVWLL